MKSTSYFEGKKTKQANKTKQNKQTQIKTDKDENK